MNADAIINRIVKASGLPRKQVLDILQKMSRMPQVQENLKKKPER
jgi:hypothetical protein